MINKGLCSICINDKMCTFPRKFPVLQCEEYNTVDYDPNKIKIRESQYKRQK